MDIKIDKATKRQDHRGFLVDFLKGTEVEPDDRMLGQIYFVTFSGKGVIRGNHYHKNRKEWFVPVKGRIRVEFRSVITGDDMSIVVNGDDYEYQRIGIGANIAHAFQALTDEAAMINYASQPYIHEAPDTYEYVLIK